MKITSESNVSARRRIIASGVLGVFALAATACTTSSTDDAEQNIADLAQSAEPAQPTQLGDLGAADSGSASGNGIDGVDGFDDLEGADGFDDLEFGVSLADIRHGNASLDTTNIAQPGYQLIDWEHLVPTGFSSEEILERYQERLAAAERGSAELDALYAEMNAEYDAASVNVDLDAESIQLAGFVAPLSYEGDRITEFLLVPYFGACIHVPAPPVNQTVMVSLPEGESLSLEESWGAVWVAGELAATSVDTDLATAGYSINEPTFGVYDIN